MDIFLSDVISEQIGSLLILCSKDFLHSKRRIVPQPGGIKTAEQGAKKGQEDSFPESSSFWRRKGIYGRCSGKLQILHGTRRMEQETNECSFTRCFRTALRTLGLQYSILLQ